jgi:hypothetical protein
MRTFATTSGVLAFLLICVPGPQAFELDGAWANNQDACAKVFQKRGNTIRVAKDSDLYGSGFVINANRITGKIANCTITTRKQDGAVLHLVAVCSTDIALQNVQFSVKPEGDNRIIRMYPGIPELDTPYSRCTF